MTSPNIIANEEFHLFFWGGGVDGFGEPETRHASFKKINLNDRVTLYAFRVQVNVFAHPSAFGHQN